MVQNGLTFIKPNTESITDIATDVIHTLKSSGSTLGAAESLTGGGLMGALTSVPGSSSAFRGGVVSYATPLKKTLLSVDEDLIAREGVVHADVAVQMAQGARAATTCDGVETTWGIGTTGVAGPASLDGKPVGTVYIGIASAEKSWAYGPFKFQGSRENVREATTMEALSRLREALAAEKLPAS